jgi:hypothetical protein
MAEKLKSKKESMGHTSPKSEKGQKKGEKEPAFDWTGASPYVRASFEDVVGSTALKDAIASPTPVSLVWGFVQPGSNRFSILS